MALMRLSKTALSDDEQGIRNLSRLGVGLLGFTALALCFQVVRYVVNEEIQWHRYWPMYRPKFWAAIGYYGFLFGDSGFSGRYCLRVFVLCVRKTKRCALCEIRNLG